MPTKKSILSVVVENETKEKIEKMAKEQRRSISNMGGYIIEEWMKEHNKISSLPKKLDPMT